MHLVYLRYQPCRKGAGKLEGVNPTSSRRRATKKNSGNTILPTGGSSGIGCALAEAFLGRCIEEYSAGPNEILIDLEGPIDLSRMLVPHPSRTDDEAIINISSGLGFVPPVRMPVDGATKARLHAFSIAPRHQLEACGTKAFEVTPPAGDTALNPEGRAKGGGYRPDLKPPGLVTAPMKGLAVDRFEIEYGMTKRAITASREEINGSFDQTNSRF
jgi:uncharacterized oxidoreductase